MNQDIISLFKAALECSVFLSPLEPGLTFDELRELGRRAGYQPGEINDVVTKVGIGYDRSKRVVPLPEDALSWNHYLAEEPELRNFDAFDFITEQLNERVRADGMSRAQVLRSAVVERAKATGIPENDMHAAITVQVMSGLLTEENDVVRYKGQGGERQLPSAYRRVMSSGRSIPRPKRLTALPIVKDLLAARSDQRPFVIEPLDAFPKALEQLGYAHFRRWWALTVAELKQCEPSVTPTAAIVLAAALVEGSLTFVVKHARSSQLEVFKSKDFDGEPRTWKLDDLIRSAASGSKAAVLDQATKYRAETLTRTRQRIHAGRMLSDFPQGTPDVRPEEARDAKAVAEQVVRCVLDWLGRFPPQTA